jgi:peptidyl-prolyl cis-trans isomerase B (cyclophilin B)
MRLTLALSLLASALLAVSLGACGDDDAPTATTSTAAQANGCTAAEKPPPKQVSLKQPEKVLSPGEKATATVQTSCGDFVIELDTKGSPKTANSFAYLAEQGVYDDTWFHRIVPGFVIQGGDPKQDGTGGPGYSVDEPPPTDAAYLKGVVAMAKGAVEPPGRSGSQFFVVTAADAGLPPDYAILGQVIDGTNVVDRIAKLGDPASGQSGTPLQPVLIETITIDAG